MLLTRLQEAKKKVLLNQKVQENLRGLILIHRKLFFLDYLPVYYYIILLYRCDIFSIYPH